MTQTIHLFWQVVRFGIVGGGAALVHFAVALLVMRLWSLSLPVANIIAFASAFWVSLLGHHFFSFKVEGLPLRQTIWRFLVVAIVGFLVNEGCVIALHQATALSNQLILIIAIVLSAAVTFVLSRIFAFKTS